jgi:hypothetical protein
MSGRCWHPVQVKLRRLRAVPILILVLVASACGGPSAGGLGGKSASQVIALAQAAATSEASFHFIDETGSGSKKQRLVGDAGVDAGQQELSGPNGVLQVRLVNSIIYLNASESVLADALKLTAVTAYANAGKWISLKASDIPYQTVLKTLSPSAEITPYVPVGNLKIGSVSTLNGRSVLAVSGTASSTVGAKAVATLYVSTTAPYVPVGGTLVGTGSDSSDSEVVAFTAWGEHVHPAVPTHAASYASLAAG